MKKENILKWIILGIAIAIDIFIIVNAFINGPQSEQESNTVAHTTAEIVNTVKPETITKENFPVFAFNIRKLVGHFCLFGLSGIFTMWTLYLFLKDTKVKSHVLLSLFSLIIGFLIACLSELVQLKTAGRTGSWTDVWIDSAGYFLGVIFVIVILFILKKKIFKGLFFK